MGGYPVDFVMEFYGKSFPEAVQMLTGEAGAGKPDACPAPSPDFRLPLHNPTNTKAIKYLTEERKIDRSIVDTFITAGDIYEDTRHNVVFVGRDSGTQGVPGIPRYAHCRGTAGKFRQDVSGSDKACNFSYHGENDQLFVFEAPIGLLSFICPYPKDWTKHSYLSQGGVAAPGRNAKPQMYSGNNHAERTGSGTPPVPTAGLSPTWNRWNHSM